MATQNPDPTVNPYDAQVRDLDAAITKQVTDLREFEEPTISEITKINKRIKSKHDQYKKSITKEGDSFKNELKNITIVLSKKLVLLKRI